MISILGFRAVYFSMRKPTEELRHGARPPAVRIATFAYDLMGLARVGVGRGGERGGGAGGLSECRSEGASAGLPPHVCRLQAPFVRRVRGGQQRWTVQRGRASGAFGARRPRKWRIFHAVAQAALLAATGSNLIAQALVACRTYLFRRFVIFTHVAGASCSRAEAICTALCSSISVCRI